MTDPRKHISGDELQKARALFEEANRANHVMRAKAGGAFKTYNDFVADMVRKHVHEDPDHSIGTPTEYEEPVDGKVSLGWGIDAASGEVVAPE